MFRFFINFLQNALYPRYCVQCGALGPIVCDKCVQDLKRVDPFCPSCHKYAIRGLVHNMCVSQTSFERLILIWKYEGVARKMILGIKYRFGLKLAEKLGQMVINELKEETIGSSYYFHPIPITKTRKKWRGFNQSEEVGIVIANAFNWEYVDNWIYRDVSKSSQTNLGKRDRMNLSKESFHVDTSKVKTDKPLILFDDVWTTGATMKTACLLLRESGVRHIVGMAICYEPLKRKR